MLHLNPRRLRSCALWAAGVAAALAGAWPQHDARADDDLLRVAVIELKNNADLRAREVSALTESARGVVAERLGDKFMVMTKENIFTLVDAQACDAALGQSCEVEMGRTLGAHYIVSGAITRLGGELHVSLKVHSTRNARLIGVREGEAPGVGVLVGEVRRVAGAAAELIRPAARTAAAHPEGGAAEKEHTSAHDEPRAVTPPRATGVSDDPRKAKLRAAHREAVRSAWLKVEPRVRQGGAKGARALARFLTAYRGHPLGNPYEGEARETFDRLEGHAEGAVVCAGRDSKSGVEWMRIPAGALTRPGRSPADPQPRTWDMREFEMSKSVVSVGQYRKCVHAGVCEKPRQPYGPDADKCTWSTMPSGKEDFPMNCVSWAEARTFAKWVGADLPTEAEWRWAAQDVWGRVSPVLQPVSAGQPNKFGLQGMAAGVQEFVISNYEFDHICSNLKSGHVVELCAQGRGGIECAGSRGSLDGSLHAFAMHIYMPHGPRAYRIPPASRAAVAGFRVARMRNDEDARARMLEEAAHATQVEHAITKSREIKQGEPGRLEIASDRAEALIKEVTDLTIDGQRIPCTECAFVGLRPSRLVYLYDRRIPAGAHRISMRIVLHQGRPVRREYNVNVREGEHVRVRLISEASGLASVVELLH